MENSFDAQDLAAEGFAASTASRAQGTDIQHYLSIVRRRALLMVCVFCVAFLAISSLAFLATPRFTGTAQVMLDSRQSHVATIQPIGAALPPESAAVDTEVEVLKSRRLADKVVTSLALDKDPEFNPKSRLANAKHDSLGAASSPNNVDKATHEDVIDHVLKRLKVARSGLTYVIDISFESRSPAKAAQIANAFADTYLLEQLDAKFEAARRASTWLNAHLAGLRTQAEASDAAVRQFEAAHGLIGIQSSQGSTITQQEISNFNTQLAQARESESEANANYQTAQAQMASGSGGDVGGALSSPVIQALRAKRSDITRQIAEMSVRLGPKHPDVVSARSQLADVDAQIKAEIGRIQSNLAAQVQIARQRTAAIDENLERSRGALYSSNSAATQLGQLQSRAQADSAVYQSFLDSFKQTSAQQGIDQSDARVVSYARQPTGPSSPNRMLTLAIAFVAGLTGAVLSAVLVEALQTGVSTPQEVEQAFGVRHLVSVPRLQQSVDWKSALRGSIPADYLLANQYSTFSEAYRQLSTMIFLAPTSNVPHVLAVTSTLPGEGKSMTALCLARVLASGGASVVVVDCDLRKRNLLAQLRTKVDVGLVELLQGRATLDETLVLDEPSSAWILPAARRSDFASPTLLSGPVMKAVLAELRARFEIVILDTPPMLAVADTKVLVARADAVLLLARWRKTPKKAISHSLQQLSALGINVLGIATTLVNARAQAKTGYGAPEYYLRGYMEYYKPPSVTPT